MSETVFVSATTSFKLIYRCVIPHFEVCEPVAKRLKFLILTVMVFITQEKKKYKYLT